MLTQRSEAFYWGLLGIFVAVVCVVLTHLVTHIDRGAVYQVGVAFNARNPTGAVAVSIPNLELHRFEIPILAPTNYDELLFIVTPATTSVTVYDSDPFEMSCAYSGDVQAAAALPTFVGLVRKEPLTLLGDHITGVPAKLTLVAGSNSVTRLATRSVWSAELLLPPGLRANLQRTELARAVIRCSFAKPIVAAPTFSDRSIVVALPDSNTGTVALDMSAFDGVENVRFAGGVSNPNGGDEVRILDAKDRLVRIEWADQAALEQRDIVLVLIGGLAAIAAAAFIESMRPAVKKRSVPGGAPPD
jgi:hypothetical protein